MTNPDAVEVVAEAVQPEVFNCFANSCSWLDHEVGPEAKLIAIKAIAAYESWLAAHAPADVVGLVDELIKTARHAQNSKDFQYTGDHLRSCETRVDTARIALLAAVQRRGVVTINDVFKAAKAYDEYIAKLYPDGDNEIYAVNLPAFKFALEAALTTEVDAHGGR